MIGSSMVNSLFESREGLLWVGTCMTSDGLPGNRVRALIPGPEGMVFNGTNGDLVLCRSERSEVDFNHTTTPLMAMEQVRRGNTLCMSSRARRMASASA